MIGFLAKRKRGKDTACDYLVRSHSYTKRAFADPLKNASKELFGFSDEQLYTDMKEEVDKNWGVSPRTVFQILGTDVVRNLFPKLLLPDIGNNFWIKNAEIWYKNNRVKHCGRVVWSDVRFQNEVDFILSMGGIIVKVERDEMDDKERELVDNHSSELCIDEINNYTCVIKNNGTLKEFYDKIDLLFKDIL